MKSLLARVGLTRVIHRCLIRMGVSSLQWYPFFDTYFEGVIPPRKLWAGPRDPLSHFLRWVYEYRAYLTLLCDMRQDSSVLELGCNHGRTMLALRDYLQPPGRYEGLDILPRQIAFAQRSIQGRCRGFRFTHADVHNEIYNPDGKMKAEEYMFPYPDGCFDIVYAASLFTHLLPEATANYFRESRRVLRKGGHCLFSFFVLDWYKGAGTSVSPTCEFEHPFGCAEGVAVHDPKVPECVIAYSSSRIGGMALNAGLKVTRILPGYWSNSQRWSVNEQDLVLLEAE